MHTENYDKAQGHWSLAKMGKKVLRPDGKELTTELIKGLSAANTDNVVEFVPGLGYTASLVLGNHPQSYIGVEANANAVNVLQEKIKKDDVCFMEERAAHADLVAESKDKVFGEAMLTMHANHRKTEIVQVAHRILKKGGLNAIHELGIFPNNLDEEKSSNTK